MREAADGTRAGAAGTEGDADAATWNRRLLAALVGETDARAALSAVCETIRELLPCDRVQIWRGDVRQMTFQTVVACGYPEDEAARLAALVAPMPVRAFAESDFIASKITFVADARRSDDPFARTVFRPFAIEAVAMLLLERGDRILGALQCSWCDAGRARVPAPEVAEAMRRSMSIAVDFLARTDEALRLSQTLSETAILLVSVHDPDELLRTIAAKTAEAVGCDWCAVHLLHEDRRALVRVGDFGLPEAYADVTRFPVDPDLLGGAFQDGVIEVPDARALDRTGASAVFGVASYFSVPLVQDGQVVGLLSLGYRERTGRFARRQLTLGKGLAPHALAALRNARVMRSLRDVNQVKTDFIAAVSHDLRTPLHVLIGYSDMLLDGEAGRLNAAQSDLVSRLREGALRFRDLINDILDVARLDAGQDGVAATPVALPGLCHELCRELDVLRRPGVELRCDVPDVTVLVDAPKIKTILRNLLSNALKFTTTGEVRIAAETASAGELRLRVSDTGPGIAPEDRPRIFDMFQQGEAGRRAGGSGLGLGLYLVKRVTDMLGGRVDLVSADPGETAFDVRLPVKSVPRPPGARP
ncbi:MAG TPA: GAF domain-containing sensor histidine kinase [Candidatus Binatia bacterium]|nr:GAF domain-containing sensor histidine kinase [Candidatus Binatia bacterium]